MTNNLPVSPLQRVTIASTTSLGNAQKLKRMQGLSLGQADTGNLLIQGDNLAVLKLLMPTYQGMIRCIYLDPPYNNNERYTHYSDTDGHDKWLADLEARIKCLRNFLTPDGSLWISIDDYQVHYLKVALDKIMGRSNFVTTIVWQQRTTRENRKVFSNDHEYVLVYALNYDLFKKSRNLLQINEEIRSRYKNPDKDMRGPWQSISLNVQAGHAVKSQFYTIVAPNGRKHTPPKGRCWCFNEERMKREIASNNVWFGADGNGVPRLKKFLAESKEGMTPHTLWLASEVGTNDQAKKHIARLLPQQKLFDTPKPEALLERIIEIATEPGDLVLDAYLGSGTTAAVAHRIRRNYIGIESGSQISSHCVQRLAKVIEHNPHLANNGFDFLRYVK